MHRPSINFYSEEIDFTPPEPRKLKQWIISIVTREKQTINFINYVFCDDEFLAKMNQEYLNHDTYTDIITFDHRETKSGALEGDVYISIDRVKENALKFAVPFKEELCRVMIHGALHLLGYKDKTPKEKSQMKRKEEESLELLKT